MDGDELSGALLRLANAPVRKPNVAALEALYRELPRLNCRGKCWSACGGEIPANPVEMARAREAGFDLAGGQLGRAHDGRSVATACRALDTRTRRCRIYKDRPMICRLWGTFEALACPWGCEPEGGLLGDVEAMRRMNLALWHGGSQDALEPGKFEQAVSIPAVLEALLAQVRSHRPVREEAVVIPATFQRRRG
ncbi:YkgJ family cysteine cluster protein [Streptomyces sp. NPDC088360]|uniref:YkgJ family cysteine cluster protein n=1 Tax=Streptomyces sp. NPDC088360 TaxID=3154515 RepID=UPI00344D99BA